MMCVLRLCWDTITILLRRLLFCTMSLQPHPPQHAHLHSFLRVHSESHVGPAPVYWLLRWLSDSGAADAAANATLFGSGGFADGGIADGGRWGDL
jgi:hypothetical protein